LARSPKRRGYSPGKIPNIDLANILRVSWQQLPRKKVFPKLAFLRQTLAEISRLTDTKPFSVAPGASKIAAWMRPLMRTRVAAND
jgi:hypothetical protein